MTSIKSAQNLLLIEKTDTIILSKKGSVEYRRSLEKLRNCMQPIGEGENEEEELRKIETLKNTSIKNNFEKNAENIT